MKKNKIENECYKNVLTVVRSYFNETFPNRWIERRGCVEYFSHSPDLTPLHFFLWGYLKDRVYTTRPDTIEALKIIIK